MNNDRSGPRTLTPRLIRTAWIVGLSLTVVVGGLVMLSRPTHLRGGDVGIEEMEARDQTVELMTEDGEVAAVVRAWTAPHHGSEPEDLAVRVAVERPRPNLRAVSVRMDPQRAGVTPDSVLLAPPGGDWPAFEYGQTSDGQLELRADGLDFNTTTLDFRIPRPASEADQDDDLSGDDLLEDGTLPIEVHVQLADGPFALRSYEGQAGFRLPLDTAPDPS